MECRSKKGCHWIGSPKLAAVIDWIDVIYPDEVDEIIGIVSANLLKRILDHLNHRGSD